MYCPKCKSKLYPNDKRYMEKYGICSYCVTFGKLPEKEAIAAGWYFGMGNLGLLGGPPFTGNPKKLTEEYGDNWDRIANEYDYYLQSLMESDKMYDDCLDEVNHWIKKMVVGDVFFINEWEKAKKGER